MYRNLIKTIAVFMVALAALMMGNSRAEALTIQFSLTDTQGSASSDTLVTIEDIVGGVRLSYEVSEVTTTADLVAVYFDLASIAPSLAATDFVNGPVTGVGFDTKNIQAGNIGRKFDVGVAIGSTGAGHGDFYDDFSFEILATDLDVTDFFGQEFAVRGQSIGTAGASSKEFGFAPTTATVVPLPAGLPLLLTAMGLLGVLAPSRSRSRAKAQAA